MSGPPPTPTRLRLLRGNKGHRPLNPDEPEPEVLKALPAPELLEGEELLKWEEVTQRLADLGMLTAMDSDILTLYCSTWADWVDAKRKLKQYGKVVRAPKSDYPVQSPYVSIEKEAKRALNRMGAEMGLTASGRSRVKVPGGKKTKLEKFLHAKAQRRQRA